MNLPLNIFSTTVTVLTGLVIYAFYASCDPRTTGEISKDDEVHIFIFVSPKSTLCGCLRRKLMDNVMLQPGASVKKIIVSWE